MQRENRYIVLKLTDVKDLPEWLGLHLDRVLDEIDFIRRGKAKQPLQCVVVEKDWPEYEPTWDAIERRMDAVPNAIELTGSPLAASPATGGSDVE